MTTLQLTVIAHVRQLIDEAHTMAENDTPTAKHQLKQAGTLLAALQADAG